MAASDSQSMDWVPTQSTSVASVLSEYARRFPKRAILVVLSMLTAGLAEGFGLAALLPLVETVIDAEQSGLAFEVVRSVLGFLGIPATLPALLLIVVTATVVKGALMLSSNIIVGFSTSRIGLELRLTLLRAIVNARLSYFWSHPIGSFGNAFGIEAHAASAVYISAFRLVALSIQLLVYLALAAATSWQITALAIVAGVIVVTVLGRLVTMARRAGQKRRAAYETLITLLTDTLQGIKPLKAIAAEERVFPIIEKEAFSLNRAIQLDVVSTESMRAAQEPIAMIFLAGSLVLGVGLLGIPFSSLLVSGFLFFRSMARLGELQREYQKLRGNQDFRISYAKRVSDAVAAREKRAGCSAPSRFDAIDFRNVSFAYSGKPAVRDVSLKIENGLITTFYGPSGAGKTTLLDLVAAFHSPDSGQVLVDSVDLQDMSKTSWRSKLGYLPQETFLFHDTIAANVALGDPDLERWQIEQALERAGAQEFIADLPDGIDTVVGERGSRFSGGQRQRIALARSIVRDPLLIVLDEPTSALDPASEREICSTLVELRENTTILAISHRPAMREISDRVYLVEAGVIVGVEGRSPKVA